MSVSVTIDHLIKSFGDATVLKDICIKIQPGELFFLLGPSGCGKTTLLRSIAGFYTPNQGRILIGDQDVTELPPHLRDTGMMFQSYALWPHMTLAENVAFGLEMRKVPKAELQKRVMEALDLVHLADRAKAKPNQLSGGQQQRVALARALVIKPQCLLLDEPLSNLDAKLRLEMRMDIRKICKAAGLTAIYVTHDQKEALSIADRLAIMRSGVVEQIGTPAEIYRHPANRFVAGFIGEANFLDGKIISCKDGQIQISTEIGTLTASSVPDGSHEGDEVSVCIRPETIRFDSAPDRALNHFVTKSKGMVYLGEIAQRSLLLPIQGAPEKCYELKAFELNPQSDSIPENTEVPCWIPQEQLIITKK